MTQSVKPEPPEVMRLKIEEFKKRFDLDEEAFGAIEAEPLKQQLLALKIICEIMGATALRRKTVHWLPRQQLYRQSIFLPGPKYPRS